jgi:hypothetical protein
MKELVKLTIPDVTLNHIPDKSHEEFANSVMSLMNLSGVDIGRSTHYNTPEEAEKARAALHQTLFSFDRTIYGCLFCLDGVTDFARQKAIKVLLSNPWRDTSNTLLTIDHERKIIEYLIKSLKPYQVFNIFLEMKNDRVNNSRLSKAIMRYILNSPKLDFWAVKYRRKLKLIFKHCWTDYNTRVIKSILMKLTLNADESRGLRNHIFKYIDLNTKRPGHWNMVKESVSFILGNDIEKPKSPVIKSYEDSKIDIEKGTLVPLEILYQVRSTYHMDTSTKADVLKITKKTMTSKQTMRVQKSAKKAGTKVAFNPKSLPMVDLLIYAYEMGMTEEILKALDEKAKKAASTLPFKFNNVGILVDASFSMSGSESTKMRPIATALALARMLANVGRKHMTVFAGGQSIPNQMIRPYGETDLANGLIDLLENEPDSIFIISDGYENAPAGRVAEVIELVEELGLHLPIYHLNPVSAAESKTGLKLLGKNISVMPVLKPETMGLTLLKKVIEQDPIRGIIGLLNTVIVLIDWKEVK